MRASLALVALALSCAACSPRIAAVRTTASVLEAGEQAFHAEPDVQLARESMPAQLELMEVFLANDPGNPRLLALACRSFAAYAFLFLQGDDDARARRFYLRARDHGLEALKARRGFDPAADRDPVRLESFLAGLGKKDADLAYWTAFAWAGWADLGRDEPQALADLALVERLMVRVEELSPGHRRGGPDLFLGSYYGGRPKLLGGDPEKAKRHFDRAVDASGGRFLLGLVLYAKHYAVQVQDRELFRRLLTKAVQTPAEILPEERLANAVARARARNLLAREEELFE